jgi:phospholipid-binding lipoprotein MlaA
VTLARPFRLAAGQAGSALLMLCLAAGGCATPPTDPAQRAIYEQNNDPLEPLNRQTLELNQFFDRILFRPVAKAYVFVVPEPGRDMIHHFLDNLKEPTLFFNNVLQGEFKRAGITFVRFLVNSSAGIGGLFDVATISKLDRQYADFGQTLFVWGVGSGPYLILPIFGPSNPRDAIGKGVDSYDDPITIVANDHGLTELMTGRFVLGGVDDRAQVLDILDNLEKNSVDFYAELRSLSQQNRNAELRHGETPATTPNLYDDPNQIPAPIVPATDKPRAGITMQSPQTAAR